MPRLPKFLYSGLTRVQLLFGAKPPVDTSAPVSTPTPAAPNHDTAQFEQALAFHRRGQLDDAEALYRALLQKYPRDFDLLHRLGMVQGQRNNFEAAINLIREALTVEPDNPAAHSTLGNCLKGINQHEQALVSYGRALALRPDDADAWNNRGAALRDLKRLDQALQSFDRALAINPGHVVALDNRGTTLSELARPDEALASYNQALAIDPHYVNAHYNLARFLVTQDNLDRAIEHFRKTLECNPNHRAAQSFMLHTMQRICRWDGLESHVESLRRSVAEDIATPENVVSPFFFMALPGTTANEQKLCTEKWVRFEYKSLAALRDTLAFNHNRPRGKKINIGYLSADFREHAMARLMVEVFELHNRDQFHVTAYSYGRDDGSAMRKRLESAFDQFVDICALTDVESARRIYADKIDILVDLAGFTANTRSPMLALRPAPLQLIYLGYLGTMGADFIDYLIADHFIVPDEYQSCYTEKILYLNNCFQPNDSKRPRPPAPTRAQCGLPEDAFIFCCFNQTYKITPDMFNVWCRLLTELPNSVLWLVSSTHQAEGNLKREAQARGVDPHRLVMAPMVRPKEYLARLQCADLYLDTTPYNAGTTCSDALWMGLPVITCAGETFSSRMAGSLLSAIDLQDLITYNLQDYYLLALDLATHRTKLGTYRTKLIANRDSAPLFNSRQFTRDLENAYRGIINHSKHVSRDAPLS